MKKIHIIGILVFTTLLSTNVLSSQISNSQAMEQVITHVDSLASEDPARPITKTVVMEGEGEGQDLFSPQNKWVTVALAVFGIVLVIVFRILRKRKKAREKTPG